MLNQSRGTYHWSMQELDADVVHEGFAPGLFDWATANLDLTLDESDAAGRLQQYAANNGFPLPDARGLSLRDAYRRLLRWLRGRRLLRDEGVHATHFEWLKFHIP